MNNDIKKLVNWAVNEYGAIRHFINHGWLQFNDYSLFLVQMKDVHYNNFHGHHTQEFDVDFNHYSDNKVHFRFEPNDLRIITYERFCKAVWNYFNQEKEIEYEQLSLF